MGKYRQGMKGGWETVDVQPSPGRAPSRARSRIRPITTNERHTTGLRGGTLRGPQREQELDGGSKALCPRSGDAAESNKPDHTLRNFQQRKYKQAAYATLEFSWYNNVHRQSQNNIDLNIIFK